MRRLEVNIEHQLLSVFEDAHLYQQYTISTAKNGPGNQMDSEQTPIGQHRIVACIGGGAPIGSVFVGREATGEIYTDTLAATEQERDWILTRILWLGGCEPGLNQGGKVDTQARYIYIHGCPDSEPMGEPRSHGCIRMRNADIIELFEQVAINTPVMIHAT